MSNPRSSSLPSRIATDAKRFAEFKDSLTQIGYFSKGTLLARRMKCGKPQCACHADPAKRHGPYFEWTYKYNGKTVNVKLSPEAAPVFRAASNQHRQLKTLLARMEKLSRAAVARLAKHAEQTASKRR